MQLYNALEVNLEKAKALTISKERKEILQVLINYIQYRRDANLPVSLNFICTHNSRRSQFSQVWAQTIADKLGIKVNCFSGGVEVTAFNERAIASLERAGFKVSREGSSNPKINVSYNDDARPIITFSKLFDDEINPKSGFAAIMTCSEADENCPFIAGADVRIPIRYKDPKEFDGTEQEEEKYDERSLQIASEMVYVFSKIK